MIWGSKLASQVIGASYALFGNVRIQLEWKPAHGRLVCIGKACCVKIQRVFETALPDVAPGSDHVGYDIDLQAHHEILKA